MKLTLTQSIQLGIVALEVETRIFKNKAKNCLQMGYKDLAKTYRQAIKQNNAAVKVLSSHIEPMLAAQRRND